MNTQTAGAFNGLLKHEEPHIITGHREPSAVEQAECAILATYGHDPIAINEFDAEHVCQPVAVVAQLEQAAFAGIRFHSVGRVGCREVERLTYRYAMFHDDGHGFGTTAPGKKVRHHGPAYRYHGAEGGYVVGQIPRYLFNQRFPHDSILRKD